MKIESDKIKIRIKLLREVHIELYKSENDPLERQTQRTKIAMCEKIFKLVEDIEKEAQSS